MSATLHTLEIARFRADPTAEFLAAREMAMTALAREFDGFISARLVRQEDGVLADQIEWASREEALRAAEQAPSIPETTSYFNFITEVVSMEHAEVLIS